MSEDNETESGNAEREPVIVQGNVRISAGPPTLTVTGVTTTALCDVKTGISDSVKYLHLKNSIEPLPVRQAVYIRIDGNWHEITWNHPDRP